MTASTGPAFPTRTFWRGTSVGTLGSPARAGVGLDGSIRLEPGWQVGWWVGAEDRWHLPEHEVAVRTRLVDEMPVVETAMRIPGGDALQRVYAVAGAGETGPLVVMEVENRSPVPVAVAVVVTGLADRLTVEATGSTATVRFRHLEAGGEERESLRPLLFDRAPAQVATARGVATAVFPLAHTGTLRVAVPLEPPAPREAGAVADGPAAFPAGVPSAVAVAKGWEAQGGRGVRVELPDEALAALLDAGRRQLLLAEGGDGRLARPLAEPGWLDWVETASLTGGLDRLGFWAESERILLTLPERLGAQGAVDQGRVDAAGAALVALDHHVAHSGNTGLAGGMVEVVAAVATGLHKRVVPGRWSRAGRELDDLGEPPPAGPADRAAWWSWWWALAGLEAAARLFRAAGQPDAARQAADDGERLRARLGEARGTAGVSLPAAVGGPLDASAWLNLWIADHLAPADRAGWLDPTCAWLAREATDGDGRVVWPDERSLSPTASLVLAAHEVRAGSLQGVVRLQTLAADAGGLRTWPERYAASGAAGRGRSPDPVATAEAVEAILDLLVHPAPDGAGLVLAPVVPERWLGQGWEVHEAPTPAGRFSYAVRWHGERPALLWQLEDTGERPAVPVRLTVPGLDPTWSTTDRRGEALLAPPAGPAPAASPPAAPPSEGPPEGASFG